MDWSDFLFARGRSGKSGDLSPEKLATEIILNFWNNLMAGDEVVEEVIHNNWQDFLWDLKMPCQQVFPPNGIWSWTMSKQAAPTTRGSNPLDASISSRSK